MILFIDGNSHRLIFDKSLQVKQLNIVEPHGILLLRAGQSCREGKVYIFRLSEIDKQAEVRTRIEVKDHRMERTRGCHLYALSRPGNIIFMTLKCFI